MNEGAERRQALADRIRDDHRRRDRRRRTTTVIVVAAVLVAIIGFLVWNQLDDDAEPGDYAVPDHATDDYGFTLTPELAGADDETAAEAVEVQIFEDFLCPACKTFHEDSAEFLAEQVADGTISITYHPFVFLLEASTDEYAQRAANAAVCVADESGVAAYVDMHGLLLDHQPDQGGAGLSDDELIDLAAEVGAEDVDACVADRTFDPWLEQALETWREADVTSTPTIRVAGVNIVRSVGGQESIPGPEELSVAIEAAR